MPNLLPRFIQAARMSSQSLPSKMKACQITEQGAISVMEVKEIEIPEIKDGQILVKNEWAGVNFIDTYQRGGLYPVKLPFTLGNEFGGTVVESNSAKFNKGDRVAAYSLGGGYAEYAAVEKRVTKLPDNTSVKDAVAGLIQGLTALTALREAHPAKSGQHILIHAAAGGLGLLLCQMASALGCHVSGTTSTDEKANLAKDNGAENVVLYKDRSMDDVVKDLLQLTPNQEGFDCVIDGVGKDTFEASFKLLKRKGTFVSSGHCFECSKQKVSIGNASGPAPAFAPLRLAEKNIKMVRPKLDNYVFTPEEFETYSAELFEMMASKKIKLALYKEDGYPLTTEGVRQAHTAGYLFQVHHRQTSDQNRSVVYNALTL